MQLLLKKAYGLQRTHGVDTSNNVMALLFTIRILNGQI
ncbi:hypothetical protein GA0116948_106133 [Chitinophaga costaii]|uniref:Uncharacterized protein n=1 Tax=Chitinophaga costaii TaxID=1335309 RepID=A0A1C4DV58_9BACT|nr:hypothetical protein GA0116948_106133 [Chitinophaga costaii]